MPDPITGVDILVKVNTGTIAVPVWTDVGGQRNATLNRSADEIDVSDKTSGGWKKKFAGLKEWSIDFDALFLESDAGMAALEAAFDARTQVQVEIAFPSGTRYYGLATVQELTIEAPYDDAATASGTLSGAAALTKA